MCSCLQLHEMPQIPFESFMQLKKRILTCNVNSNKKKSYSSINFRNETFSFYINSNSFFLQVKHIFFSRATKITK